MKEIQDFMTFIEKRSPDNPTYEHVKHSYDKGSFEVKYHDGKWQSRPVTTPYSGEWSEFNKDNVVEHFNENLISIASFHTLLYNRVSLQGMASEDILKEVLELVGQDGIDEKRESMNEFFRNLEETLKNVCKKKTIKLVE